jgi:hypothetical protein
MSKPRHCLILASLVSVVFCLYPVMIGLHLNYRAGPEAKKLLSKKKLHRSSQEDVHVPPPFYNGYTFLSHTLIGMLSLIQ